MSAKLQIQNTIIDLQQRKSNLCCDDVKSLLVNLGFEVRDGKRGGNKVFFNKGLPSFINGSFNCGHGKNPEIKPAYIVKIIQVLKHYNDKLVLYLEKTSLLIHQIIILQSVKVVLMASFALKHL